MGDLLKFKYVLITVGILIITLISIYLFRTNAIIVKPFFKIAQVLVPEKAGIYVDDKIAKNAQLFGMGKMVNGKSVEMLVLWIPNEKSEYKRKVLLIDKKNSRVFRPYSDEKAYQLFFNYYLFQAQGADYGVALNDPVKAGGPNPELKIKQNEINFKISSRELEGNMLENKVHLIRIIINR